MEHRYLSNVVTLQLDEEKCSGCGSCLDVCPHQVFAYNENKSRIRMRDRDACMECGACAKNCPREAIKVRAGVGCAYAVVMNKLKRKGVCCGSECGCEIDFEI